MRPLDPTREERRDQAVGTAIVAGIYCLPPLTIMAVLLVILLAGCAKEWQRPGATQAALDADRLQCKYESDKATAAIANPVAAGMQEGVIMTSCLRSKGWTR